MLVIVTLVIFIIVDFILSYKDFKASNYKIVDVLRLDQSTKNLFTNIYSFNQTNDSKIALREAVETNSHLIKRLLCPPVGIHLHEPIADFFLDNFFLKKGFITHQAKANAITIVCVFMSFPIFFLLIRESNQVCCRRLACVLFQIRNILDFMDGKLARHGKLKTSQSQHLDYDVGRIYDAFGSSFPTFFFLLGSFFFILNTLNVLHGFNEQEIRGLNIFYRSIHRSILWLKNKLFSCDKKTATITLKVELLKNVYYCLTLFLIYIILAGIVWNKVLDSNKFVYGDYQIFVAVSFDFIMDAI